MKGAYEHKPTKEKKALELPVTHCKTCKHFLWGLITPYSDYDGARLLDPDNAKRKNHAKDGCGHWERK